MPISFAIQVKVLHPTNCRCARFVISRYNRPRKVVPIDGSLTKEDAMLQAVRKYIQEQNIFGVFVPGETEDGWVLVSYPGSEFGIRNEKEAE